MQHHVDEGDVQKTREPLETKALSAQECASLGFLRLNSKAAGTHRHEWQRAVCGAALRPQAQLGI